MVFVDKALGLQKHSGLSKPQEGKGLPSRALRLWLMPCCSLPSSGPLCKKPSHPHLPHPVHLDSRELRPP